MQKQPSAGRFKRHKTRHPGITYREVAGGKRAYYAYAQGRQHLAGSTEGDALAKQAELRGKVHRGETIPRANVKLGPFAEEWLNSKRRLRPWTRANYRAALDKVILPRFRNHTLASITADDVAQLVRELEERGLSAAYIDNLLKPLAGVFKLALRRRHISVSPLSLLMSEERPQRKAKAVHEWTPEEIASFLSASRTLAAKPASRYDYTPIVYVATYAGLRLGELLGLRWGDVDLTGEQPELHVQRQWTRLGEFTEPKTGAAVRRIPLGPSMVKFLAAHKLASQHSTDESLVFASRKGTPLTHRNVQRRGFEATLAESKLDGELTFHDLRHAFASIMVERGVSEFVLAKLMGHKDAATTRNTYVHLFNRQRTDAQVREAMEEAMAL